MERESRAHRIKVALAFFCIYFLWGSTFLAIRIGVQEVPPLLFAAMRFFTAGLVLYLGLRIAGVAAPVRAEWRSAAFLAVLIFLLDYGFLFWAEQRVPSGSAAILMATIPLFMALSEIYLLGTQKMTARLAGGLLVGLAGVAVLVGPASGLGEAPVDSLGAGALLVAAASWSVAAALSKRLPLPDHRVMSAAAQMLAGGALLFVVSALFGEWGRVDLGAVSAAAWFALGYQIVAGSILAYTAYVWLLHHVSPTRVGSYAYVNPVVAVFLGWLLAGETIGARTITGTTLVIVSVIVLMTLPRSRPARSAS